jgi:hypothetical protein
MSAPGRLALRHAEILNTAIRQPQKASALARAQLAELGMMDAEPAQAPPVLKVVDGMLEQFEADTRSRGTMMAWAAFDAGADQARRRVGALVSKVKGRLPRWMRWLPVRSAVEFAIDAALGEVADAIEARIGPRPVA